MAKPRGDRKIYGSLYDDLEMLAARHKDAVADELDAVALGVSTDIPFATPVNLDRYGHMKSYLYRAARLCSDERKRARNRAALNAFHFGLSLSETILRQSRLIDGVMPPIFYNHRDTWQANNFYDSHPALRELTRRYELDVDPAEKFGRLTLTVTGTTLMMTDHLVRTNQTLLDRQMEVCLDEWMAAGPVIAPPEAT